jgi:nucleoside 2-deoxyribosyltransferase
MYYLATPMYRTDVKHSEKSPERQLRNEKIANILEENGIEIILPQRDIEQEKSGKQIMEQEFELIKNSNGLIIILSDTRGIYIEAGYAKALGKPVIALMAEETRELSEWGRAFFDHIASDVHEVISIIKENETEKNFH